MDFGLVGIEQVGVMARGLGLAVFVGMLAYVSLTDVRRRVIPNRALAVAFLARLAYLLCVGGGMGGLARSLAGGLAAVAPVLVVALVLCRARGAVGVGGGDVKLLFVVGCYLGWWGGLLVETLACLAGSLASVARSLVAREPVRLQEGFPLAPYVAAACLVVLLAGALP